MHLFSSASKAVKLAALVAILALVAAACRNDSGSDTPAAPGSEDTSAGSQEGGSPSGSVTFALAVEVPSLNPILGSKALAIQKSIFDWLTYIGPDGKVVPRLATEWEVSEDATQWTFTIRTDAVFHDGTPVTIDDVIFSYQTLIDAEKSTIRGHVAPVESMERVSDTQVRFNLNQTFAAWPRQTSLIPIVPAASYDPVVFDTQPIGSGPYQVVSFSAAEGAQLTAFDDYWGEAPAFRDVTVVPAPAADNRLTGLQSSADNAFDLAPINVDQVPVIQGDSFLDVVSTPSNFVAYLSFNVTQPPLDDPLLRQAITTAVDRQAISDTLLGGLAKPVGQMVAPVTFGFDPSIEATKYDPERARQLVEESSYGGETIIFDYPTDGELPASNDLAQAIQSYLREVGINVELAGRPSATFIPAVQNKQMRGMFMFSWRPSILDAGQILNLSFRSSNWGYPENPEMEELITQSFAETDEDARAELISQIWQLNQENTYFAPLFNDQYHYGFRPDIVSYSPRADGLIFAHEIGKP